MQKKCKKKKCIFIYISKKFPHKPLMLHFFLKKSLRRLRENTLKMQLPTLWLNFSFAVVASRCKKNAKNATSGQNRKSKKNAKKCKLHFLPPSSWGGGGKVPSRLLFAEVVSLYSTSLCLYLAPH